MTNEALLASLLSVFLGSLPTVLVCIVAMVVVGTQGQRIPGAVPWALTGFALALVMSVVGPFSGVLLQSYFASHYLSFDKNAWMFGVLGVANSTLHGAALVFLLVAVFAGRRASLVPPPLPPL